MLRWGEERGEKPITVRCLCLAFRFAALLFVVSLGTCYSLWEHQS